MKLEVSVFNVLWYLLGSLAIGAWAGVWLARLLYYIRRKRSTGWEVYTYAPGQWAVKRPYKDEWLDIDASSTWSNKDAVVQYCITDAEARCYAAIATWENRENHKRETFELLISQSRPTSLYRALKALFRNRGTRNETLTDS